MSAEKNLKFTNKDLEYLQALPLELKIKKTQLRIKEWYEYWEGDVFVSFSGGKDSTVLLDIARQIYPDIPAVFANTGLEYPEIRDFVKSYDNITIVEPEHNFKWILTNCGYPVISKEVARTIEDGRRFIYDNLTSCKDYIRFQLDMLESWVSDNVIPKPVQAVNHPDYDKPEVPIPLADSGINSSVAMLLGLLRKDKRLQWVMNRKERSLYNKSKWRWLLNSDFKISDKCCDYMKKAPLRQYIRDTGMKPILGTMADESALRLRAWLKYGCNMYTGVKHSNPMSFWTEQDVLQYIKENNLTICSVYGKIVEEDGQYHTTGCRRTGCIFCMFGVQMEKEPNRFQMLKETHPKLYSYCMNGGGISDTGWWIPTREGLGMKHVLDFIRVKTE